MAKFFSKASVKSAIEGTNEFYKEARSVSTSDFMRFNITKAIWMTKGKHKLSWKMFSNMEPMPQPTWADVTFKNRIWFVPFRQVFKGFEDFTEDLIHNTANMTSLMLQTTPYTTIADITKAIIPTLITNQQGNLYIQKDNQEIQRYSWTYIGKIYYSLITSLYGKLPLNAANNKEISMLPLLCALKVYLTYYYNNAYKHDTQYNTLEQFLKRDNGQLRFTSTEVGQILSAIRYANYEDDEIVSCWDKPNSPNIMNYQESEATLMDDNGTYTYRGYGTNSTYTGTPNVNNRDGKDPIINTTGSNAGQTNSDRLVTVLTQNILQKLKAFTSYLKRNQLAGASVLQRYLLRWGIELTEEKINTPKEIGKYMVNMEVSPIFANADTATQGGEPLGTYAGNGVAMGQWVNFEFETNEMGILLLTKTIQPDIINADGIDGMAFTLTKFDFPIPEFDNVGVDAIRATEVCSATQGNQQMSEFTANNHIFGYLPRYSRWKYIKDTISGDYLIEDYKDQLERYIIARSFNPDLEPTNYTHAKEFTQGLDAEYYDKIFYGYKTGNVQMRKDNFRLFDKIRLQSWCNLKPMYEYYDWEHETGKEYQITTGSPFVN